MGFVVGDVAATAAASFLWFEGAFFLGGALGCVHSLTLDSLILGGHRGPNGILEIEPDSLLLASQAPCLLAYRSGPR